MADDPKKDPLDPQSVTALVSGLALSIAAAQEELDEHYVDSLSQLLTAVKDAGLANTTAETLSLIKSIAPSRYQFTETTLEVRADIRMAEAKELEFGVSATFKNQVAAVAVNASYIKRSGYDYRSAARIRTVLHAIPADPGLIDKYLQAARQGDSIQLFSKSTRFEKMIGNVPKLEASKAPALPSPASEAAPPSPTDEEKKAASAARKAAKEAREAAKKEAEKDHADEAEDPEEQDDSVEETS